MAAKARRHSYLLAVFTAIITVIIAYFVNSVDEQRVDQPATAAESKPEANKKP